MAVSWSFALLLVLTLVALITFSQPLFRSTPEVRHTREDLETAPPQILPTNKARETMVGSKRQQRTRKVIQCGKELRLHDICNGKRKTIHQPNTFSNTKLTTIVDIETHPPAARSINARIPRRLVSAYFESDRMVPTGPNPLHNNNRSQIIFP